MVEETKTNVKNEAIKQVKDSIDYMKQGSYKINGLDHYTPIWYLISDIADTFDLFDYDFDLDDFDEFEDEDEAYQNIDDITQPNAKDIIGYTPSKKDIARANKEKNYLEDNYDYTEILDTYNFEVPRPLTYKDIMDVFKKFKKTMLDCKVTDEMAKNYQKTIAHRFISDWAD